MKKIFLSLTFLLLLSLTIVACTQVSDTPLSTDSVTDTMQEVITSPDSLDTTQETTPSEIITDVETQAGTQAETEAVTDAPKPIEDIKNTFASNLSSNQAGTTIDQTDLASFFTFWLNLGAYQTTQDAYILDGISEMYTNLDGAYALTLSYANGSAGPGYAFVRGAHKLLSTDESAQPLVAYFETDGSISDMGGAGIYAKIDGGLLSITIKVYDEKTPSRVKNVYYATECVGSELTLADNGHTVYVLVDDVTYATIELSGATSYDGFSQVEPQTEFASTAKITLKNGTMDTLTNTLVDSDCTTQGGITVRAGVIAFDSVKVRAFSDVTIPQLKISSGKVDISQRPDFKVSSVFSSHMVLQRDTPITVWGFSNTKGSVITGTFDGETATTTVASDGTWTLTFPAHAYTKVGQSMIISDDRGNTTTLEDILIGDVWFIGGQSNAELTVSPCMNYTQGLTISADDNIRLFTQTQAYAASQKDACQKPQEDIINPAWCWKRADRSAVMSFSAMGYFFAKEVSKDTDVPQGLIMIAAGGACLSELLPADLARKQGYSVGGNVCIGGYYNTLINPFVGLPCKGMLFFQGESEGGQKALADKYAKEMTLLIQDERTRWGQDFPLYFVQLSNYLTQGSQYFPYHDIVRMQQFKALETIPNSTMVVAMDLGAPANYADWAHSPYKYELGRRLAKVVLAKEYGVGQVSQISSPTPVSATLSADEKTITIKFENVADGLKVYGLSPEESIGKTVAGFSVGRYQRKKDATATITAHDTIVVDVPSGVDETLVNYAYFMLVTTELANLYASNDLPAPAFTLTVES